MEYTGCLKLNERESSRRAFLQVGSLGFLGINLSAATSSRDDGERAARRSLVFSCGLKAVPVRWTHGIRSQLGIQANLNECCGNPNLRTAAASRQANGQTVDRALNAYQRERITLKVRIMRLPDMK